MQRSVHPSRCPPGLGFSAAPQRPYGTAGVVTRHSVARRSASASAAPLAVESKQGAFPPRAPRPHWPTAAALAACAALASALTAPPAAAAHAAAAPAAAALQPAGEWAARRLARAVLIPFATTWVAVAVLNHLAQQAEQLPNPTGVSFADVAPVAFRGPAVGALLVLLAIRVVRNLLAVLDDFVSIYRPNYGILHDTIDPMVDAACAAFVAVDKVIFHAYGAVAVAFATWGLIELKALAVKSWVTSSAHAVTRSDEEEEDKFLSRAEEARARREMQKAVLPLSTLFDWVIIAAGATLVLHLLGVNVVPLLTVGSASTLILGLASQQLLSNAVTGVSIFFSNTFAPGDSVTLMMANKNEVSGTVLQVTPMRTILRDEDGVVISLPNKSVTDMVIFNKSRVVASLPSQLGTILRQPLRLRLRLGGGQSVASLSDLREEALSRLAAAERAGVMEAGTGKVAFGRLTEAGVELLLSGTLLTTDFGVSGKGAQELMIDLYSIAKTHGAACSTLT